MDGWYCDDDKSRSGSSSGSLPQSLLESYGLSFCNNENRDYVSLGYKGEDCLDLENSETLNSISMQLQQQSYEKTQFEHEEIEFDMSAFGNMYKQMDMAHLLPEDSLRQSEFEEFLQSEQWHQSSSSSSQRSLSTSSPECSIQAYDQYQNVKFPTLKCEDMIITQAISTIFSTSSCSIVLDQSLRQVQMNRSLVAGHSRFKP